MSEIEELRTALQLILDSVDYTTGSCGVTEMVGAVLPVEIIARARTALRAGRDPEGGRDAE